MTNPKGRWASLLPISFIGNSKNRDSIRGGRLWIQNCVVWSHLFQEKKLCSSVKKKVTRKESISSWLLASRSTAVYYFSQVSAPETPFPMKWPPATKTLSCLWSELWSQWCCAQTSISSSCACEFWISHEAVPAAVSADTITAFVNSLVTELHWFWTVFPTSVFSWDLLFLVRNF